MKHLSAAAEPWLTLALMVLAVPWEGFVISILWRWFVVPTLHVPALPIAAAIGITMMVRLVAWRPDVAIRPRKVWEAVTAALGLPAIVLASGWLVTWWL